MTALNGRREAVGITFSWGLQSRELGSSSGVGTNIVWMFPTKILFIFYLTAASFTDRSNMKANMLAVNSC